MKTKFLLICAGLALAGSLFGKSVTVEIMDKANKTTLHRATFAVPDDGRPAFARYGIEREQNTKPEAGDGAAVRGMNAVEVQARVTKGGEIEVGVVAQVPDGVVKSPDGKATIPMNKWVREQAKLGAKPVTFEKVGEFGRVTIKAE